METAAPPDSALVGLRPAILSILRGSDLSEVTAKKVRQSLEKDGLLAKAGIDTEVKTHKRAVDKEIRFCFDHVSSGAPLPGQPAAAPASSAPVAFGGIALPGMGGIPGGGASAASASNGHSSSAPSSSSASASKKRKKVKGEDEISSEEEDDDEPAPKAKKKTASSSKKSTSKKSKAGDDGEKKAPNPNNPFNRPVVLSDDMAAMCGDREMPRYMITKKLWEYIKGKDLQNPQNKREILCDAKLQHLFGKDKVDSFEMAKLITKHVSKKET